MHAPNALSRRRRASDQRPPEPQDDTDARLALRRADQTPQQQLALAAEVYARALTADDTLTQGEALHLQARALCALREWRAALDSAERAARAHLEAGQLPAYLETLTLAARAGIELEEHETVLARTDEIMRLCAEAGLSSGLAEALHHRATVLVRQGNYHEAIECTQRGAALCLELDDPEGHARCLSQLGLIHRQLGDDTLALQHLLKCLEYLRACARPLDALLVPCLVSIGGISRERQEYDTAARHLEQAVEVATRAGLEGERIAGITELGLVHRERGQLREAVGAFLQGLQLARTAGRRQDEAELLGNLGQMYALQDQHDLAERTYQDALNLTAELEAAPSRIGVMINLGALLRARGRPDDAWTVLSDALHLARHTGARGAQLRAHEALAETHEDRGEHQDAAAHYRASLNLTRELSREDSGRRAAQLAAQFELEKTRYQTDVYRLLNEAAQKARQEAESAVRERTVALEQAHLETVVRLALAAEYRDDRTGLHTHRVGDLSAKLGAAIGLEEEEVEVLRLAARLHDLGKIGVPDAVLLKRGRFSADEYEIMKHHTTIGARLLQGGRSPLMRMAEQIAMTHHEHWDGSGYPQALRGEQIPLYGRIVAIADVWDALITERPYKPAWTHEHAREELRRLAGAQFDPQLVDVFLQLLNDLEATPRGASFEETYDSLPPGATPTYDVDDAHAELTLDLPVIPDTVIVHVDNVIGAAWELRMTDPPQGLALSRAGLELAEQHGYRRGAAYGARNVAFFHFRAGELREALDLLPDALQAAQDLADRPLERDCANLLAGVYSALYNDERAAEYCLAALEMSRELRDAAGEANALTNLGVLLTKLGEREKALERYREALAIFQRIGNRLGSSNCLYNIADALLELGEHEQAIAHGEAAARAAREIGSALVETLGNSVAARALDALGQHARATVLHQEALARVHTRNFGAVEVACWTALYFAMNREALGLHEEALVTMNDVLRQAHEHDLRHVTVAAHRALTALHRRLGRPEAAMRHLQGELEQQRELHQLEKAQRTRSLMTQYEVERTAAEADIYRLRSVELAAANVALEKANREKAALVTALQEQSRVLEKQLREDALTGLFNRRYIESSLSAEFELHRQQGRPLVIGMADIDSFKQVNDTLSHVIGDEVLRRVAEVFLRVCRVTDHVARYGGEEFLLVFPETTLEQGLAVAKRIRAAVESYPWHDIHPALRVTLSIGLTDCTAVANHERMISLADAQLYEAKLAGRNRVHG